MAVSLSHVEMANNEATKTGSINAIDKIQMSDNIEIDGHKTENEFIIFRMVKKRSGRTYIDNCAKNVYNEKTKQLERIWYLDGANSIWDSDLSYILSNKDRYDRSRRGMEIYFIDGVLRVNKKDRILLEFLRANPNNVGKKRNVEGKWAFYEYNPAEEQQERHKKQLLQIEMVLRVKEMKYDDIKKLASFFGISFVDDIGLQKSEEGIRTELMLKAQSDPATFQKHINSKEVEVVYAIKKLILDNKIQLSGEGNRTVSWASGGGLITKVPQNRKTLEYLLEFAMSPSEAGSEFLKTIKKQNE